MTASPLSHAVSVFNEIKARIASDYGLANDDQALIDTVAGETNIDSLCCTMIREALASQAQADGMADHIKAMKARESRLHNRHDRLRGIVAWAMQETGQSKIQAPDFTISIRAGKPGLSIDEMDPANLPDEFATVTVTTTPNRAAIRAALEENRLLDFARLGNPQPVLTVRTK